MACVPLNSTLAMSPPLSPDEDQRLEELRRYAAVYTPPEKAFDDITKLAARIFETPIAAITLIDEDRQWFKSCVGLETREVGRNFAFGAQAILGAEVMVVPDARADPRFAADAFVTGPPHIRFYAGAPLRTRNGLHLGTLAISDTKARKLTKREIATLAGLATLVVAEMQLRYEIGERRRGAESLRLLQAAMEQTSESVIITTAEVDLPGPEIIFVNPAFTKITGYTADEVIGRTPRIFQGPKTDRAILDRVRAELASGEESHFEVVNYRKDGSDFLVSCHISPIRGDEGAVTHFICSQHDTTERERAASALQRAKEEAETANRAKSEFLSRMSHELRTPLHAILGFAKLLELEDQRPDDAESVVMITRAGKLLLGLINELLDLASLESGKLPLTPEPVCARDILEMACSLMKPQAIEQRVRLEPLAGDLDCHVLCDRLRFKQVILNLLSNAVKFNRDGGKVAVSCEKMDKCLRVKVADTGRGISVENMAKLFAPFERLDAGATGREGAGLGLSLSKLLVEAMNGRIGVESTPGRGSTFWVELPLLRETPAAKTGILAARASSVEEEPRRATPRTLLYIEDNPSNLRLVERILARRPEVTLLSAKRGATGLELARQYLPDLILLDLQLPDIQGDEILRRLRDDSRTQHIPSVIISADANSAQIERLLAAGADDYLTKPIDARRFLALVDAIEPRDTEPR